MSNRTRNLLCILALVMGLTLYAPVGVFAGGLFLYEIGTPDTGYASAGYAARACDPGTILTNPAGMTHLKESQLTIGGHLLYGHGNFSPDRLTTDVPGSDGGNAIGLLPSLSAFGTYKVNQDLTLGLGMCSNFGLGLWYDSNWVGRYYAKEAILMGMSFLPAAAYRVSDQLSVGVALNVMLGYMNTKLAINNVDPRWPDGELDLKDTTVGVGANVGLMYELNKGTRFGVTYSSPVNLNFSATPEFSTLAPGIADLLLKRGTYFKTIDMGITVPQTVMVSFFHELDDKWALLGNFGWQNWSRFGEVEVSFSTSANSLTTQLNFNDTWHGALGAQYRFSEPLLLTGGIAYDSSMMDVSNRSPALPLGWSWRFATGAQYALSPTTQLGLAYEYMYSGNPEISKSGQVPVAFGGRGNLNGSYPNSSIQFLSANVTRKF